jgi:hypothetical protein
MQIFDASEIVAGERNKKGAFVVAYGGTGDGKTTAALLSAPQPSLFISGESRDPKRWLEFAMHSPNVKPAPKPDLATRIVNPANFFEAHDYICEEANLFDAGGNPIYKSLFFDGSSHFMNVDLFSEAQDQHFESKGGAEGLTKSLMVHAKGSKETYGIIGAEMNRLFKTLGKISERGVLVVVIALPARCPSYAPEYDFAPSYTGKMFGESFPGAVDFIGFVRPRFDGNGVVVYPPMISMALDGTCNYLCKCTGDLPGGPNQPLDFEKIFCPEEVTDEVV